MKMIIRRELTRPPAGKYPGIIYDWDIEEKTSQRGGTYFALILSIKTLVNGQLMDVDYTIPMFWNPGDPMYNLCNTFGVLPALFEEFNSEILIGKHTEITVRENSYNGRTYSNVVHAEPLQGALPDKLKVWFEQRLSLASASDSIFDEEADTDDITPDSLEPAQLEKEPTEGVYDQLSRPGFPRRKKIIPPKKP